MKDMIRNAVLIIVGFIVLWYVGAMFNFLPFLGDYLEARANAYTGLLVSTVIVICTCWIISEIRKGKDE